ncbi:MAG: helix-turn-helix domain-containing protein [Actinomycetota bacterium]|nr:helix-turn-helix domain-containing protein [Actinomycetota bacterium]
MDTRGILRPAAVDTVFRLERRPPPRDLERFIDGHWIVSWDLRGREPYRSEVMPHPAVHMVFEPAGVAVFGVHRRRYDRVLRGRGWAVGTKFRPGGFASFVERPICELTDTAVSLDEVFGAAGERLGRQAAGSDEPDVMLAALHGFLRPRLPERVEPGIALVDAAVADMRTAPPGTRVAEIASRHNVSTRTLQRLFRRYVGVGPKWVLQRYRLHTAIEQLASRQGTDWTRLALELGYFDHAHFIADFQALVGRSPAQYEAEAAAAPR